ncbi:hypothetical protein NPIL_380301, partial [Nephila pilipes]
KGVDEQGCQRLLLEEEVTLNHLLRDGSKKLRDVIA